MKSLFSILLFFSTSILSAQTKADSCIKISGEVTQALTLCKQDLVAMKKAKATLKDKDGKSYVYTGVPLTELLTKAGVTMGKELHGENLSKYLLAKAADGYQVLFSLAELDSNFTDRVVILAYEIEGKPLPKGKGPFRVIVPNEGRPARSVFEVVEFVVRFAKD